MSARAMAWAWEQALRIGPKFVLIALADHADGKGICWPGQELIAEKCGLSRQTVSEHVRALISAGLVAEERSKDAKGRAEKVRYHLQLERLPMQPASADAMSGKPTSIHVGISDKSMSGFDSPYKVEPEAIEPKPPTPLFELDRKSLEVWFDRVFWPRYPKKVRRAKAFEQLIEMKPDQVMLDAIAAGLEHRIAAEAFAQSRDKWFRAWPDPHRWLKPREKQWLDRFDVPRETTRDESRCWRCPAPAVGVAKGKPHCRQHDPAFDQPGASA